MALSPEVRDLQSTSSRLDYSTVKNVLDTRPSLQSGRSMSMRFRANSAFSKNGSAYKSATSHVQKTHLDDRVGRSKKCHIALYSAICVQLCLTHTDTSVIRFRNC